MDRIERAPDPTSVTKRVLAGHQASVWTALPGIIKRYDRLKQVVDVQPAIQARFVGRKGVEEWITLPLLINCPVCFQGGGGFTLTFPLKVGDECLVVFASRCIDAWWMLGDVQKQMDFRMHDLSDGFVLPGVRSQVKLPSLAASASHVELRSDDGDAIVRITSNGKVQVTADTAVEVTAPTITITGNVTINGTLDVTGHVVGEGIDLHDHVHSDVDSGSSNSGPPVP